MIVLSSGNVEDAKPYIDSLLESGANKDEIVVVTPERFSPQEAFKITSRASGVLLSGGSDVEPKWYGEKVHPDAEVYTFPKRDLVEMQILRASKRYRIPLFAICRGMQLLNVFEGGSLWQDLSIMWPGAMNHKINYPRDLLVHTLRVIDKTTPLGSILDSYHTYVNSRHHQAIKKVAPTLKVVALSPEGIIEAVESRDKEWWCWGVQWHPETIYQLQPNRDLIAAFVEVALKKSLVKEGV